MKLGRARARQFYNNKGVFSTPDASAVGCGISLSKLRFINAYPYTMNLPPERLGSFYLGAKYDLDKGKITAEPVNYDARDLTTHMVCLGMTGSGKTGLCICLLEEAALDKVPAIIIDPKGDITNLLLQFPDLETKDFHPWINADDARRKGMSLDEYAASAADTWKKGLADWGITGERINQLKQSVEYTIFTPGSESGIPISILNSLASPKLDFRVDGEMARDRITGTVSALIDLLDLKIDSTRSQEGILLSNIFEYYWSRNEDLTLEKIITSIQKPPFSKLGVFDLETFYPSKDRFQLAIAMNTLIASPSFQSWLEGESLDVDRLLYNTDGKPRHSIFYLAHLSDSERMFIVTLLLENILTWVRRQQGTTSLKALLYFDEVFGFMPPVAEPSSKKPLITLLKQSRAIGLGVTLVTQNPVDIDYKGLTNTGTWLIGKLQAEKDKEKIIEGLRGAIAESSGVGGETNYNLLINKLSSRVFLMHNIHQGPPQVITSRWAMSYLRGPLTKPQINDLMRDRKAIKAESRVEPIRQNELFNSPPSLDPRINQVYVNPGTLGQVGNILLEPNSILVYKPHLMATTSINYYDKRLGVDRQISETILFEVEEQTGVNWGNVSIIPSNQLKYSVSPQINASFTSTPSQINTYEKLTQLGKSVINYFVQNSRLRILSHKELNLTQGNNEDERTFIIRLRDAARELRDVEVKKIQDDYEEKIDRVETKMHSLERGLQSDKEEVQARKREEYVGVGETLLSFFIGRKKTTGITTASRRRRMTEKAEDEAEEKTVKIEELKKDIGELESDLKSAIEKVTYRWENVEKNISVIELKPKSGDVKLDQLALAWIPKSQLSRPRE
jgi:hypothetical protein